MKTNRKISFLLVTLVYVLASVVGILCYNILDLAFWLRILIADVIATILVFIFSVILKNASVYDPYWSVAPIVILGGLSFEYGLNITGWLVLIAVIVWGVRLTLNWAYTFKDLTHEDWRYRMLHQKTGKFYPIINFVGIHMVPTLVVYFCIMPFAYLIATGIEMNALTIVFFVLCLLSALLQGVSDIQMHKFRKNKNSVFIRNGVWKYSRHPNYLAEILMWWSAGLMAVFTFMDRPYLLLGAILNTLLFLFVSIPMAENHQRQRKAGFDLYKRQTRMLLPIKKPLL